VFAQMAVRGGQLGFHKNSVCLYCFFICFTIKSECAAFR